MWESIGYHKNKIFAIRLFIGVFFWLYIPEEDLEDPYTISIDFDCREVIRDPSDTPRIVIEECIIIIDQQRKDNEPKSNRTAGCRT
jgi:hypothetical protein